MPGSDAVQSGVEGKGRTLEADAVYNDCSSCPFPSCDAFDHHQLTGSNSAKWKTT